MNSIAPSIYESIDLNVCIFQKICRKTLISFKVLDNLTKGLSHLELFRPFASEVLDLVHICTLKFDRSLPKIVA